jgi:hypothetical protein
MRLLRSPFRRNRSRGGAAVEMLLSVPFLFIFPLATFDFVRGTRTVACGHRAARHVAWCMSRNSEDSTYPGVPAPAAVNAHYYDSANEPTVATGTEEIGNPVSDVFAPVSSLFEEIGKLFGMDGGLGRGLISFVTGAVDLDSGTVTKQASGLRMFAATVTATHKVSLRSRPEETPSDPIGWFDPIRAIMDEIEDLFDL